MIHPRHIHGGGCPWGGNGEKSSPRSCSSGATISNGKLTSSGGAATITVTATAADGGGTVATCQVPATTVSISPQSVTMYVGDKITLSGSVAPSNVACEWISWGADRATIDQNGVVTAVAVGTPTLGLRAKDNMDVKATIVINVQPRPVATTTTTTSTTTKKTNPTNATSVDPPFTPSGTQIEIDKKACAAVKDRRGTTPLSVNTNSAWYKNGTGQFVAGISRGECPWYALGRVGEVFHLRPTFDGSRSGGWWIANSTEKAEVWKNDGSAQMGTSVNVKIETNINNIKSHSIVSWRYVNTGMSGSSLVPSVTVNGKTGAAHGHVAFIEAVERDDKGNPTYVWYSEGYQGCSPQGILRRVPFSTFATYNSKYEVATPLGDTRQFQGYIQFY